MQDTGLVSETFFSAFKPKGVTLWTHTFTSYMSCSPVESRIFEGPYKRSVAVAGKELPLLAASDESGTDYRRPSNQGSISRRVEREKIHNL